TDVFAALRQQIAGRAGVEYGAAERSDFALRLLADHARATAFLVVDGVRAGNEGRGYVLRRMVRRATLHGQLRLGLEDALSGAVGTVGELMGDAYPELRERAADIARSLAAEEAA